MHATCGVHGFLQNCEDPHGSSHPFPFSCFLPTWDHGSLCFHSLFYFPSYINLPCVCFYLFVLLISPSRCSFLHLLAIISTTPTCISLEYTYMKGVNIMVTIFWPKWLCLVLVAVWFEKSVLVRTFKSSYRPCRVQAVLFHIWKPKKLLKKWEWKWCDFCCILYDMFIQFQTPFLNVW